jgi:hypothetical protein
MKIKIITGSLILLMTSIFYSCRKSDYEINAGQFNITDNGLGTGTVTWTNDKSYTLDGLVFVNDGQTLTIQAGTVIHAKTGQGENASALIIARGGKIIAKGTAENPIIFTVEGDDLEGSVPFSAKGLWGGIIILGNAELNTSSGEALIEGISFSEPRGVYGGSNNQDNSGILEYVSIRHGGTNIGEGNEINGLTLGGVGSGTIIDHVEIIANKDDGIECFGGTVNLKNIIVAFCGDDCFDFDNGYTGNGQFWLAIQDPNEGDLIIEHDGGSDPINGLPYSLPTISNGTFIGRGASILNNLIIFKENAGGIYANNIFINQGYGINIEYNSDTENCFNHIDNNRLKICNNIFYNVAQNEEDKLLNIFSTQSINLDDQNNSIDAYFLTENNEIRDPGIIMEDDLIELIPMNELTGNKYSLENDWFESVEYKGAFGHYNWAYGWTLLSEQYFNK